MNKKFVKYDETMIFSCRNRFQGLNYVFFLHRDSNARVNQPSSDLNQKMAAVFVAPCIT